MSNQAATAPGIKKAQIAVVPTSASVLRASDFPVPPLLLLLLALAVVVRLVVVLVGVDAVLEPNGMSEAGTAEIVVGTG